MNDEINKIIQSISDFYKLDNALKYYLDRHKAQILLDYITNLQQENQDLSRVCELYGKSLYNAELTDYKSRIEKAVEELELWQPKIESLKLEKEYLLNILNGRSDE